MREIKIVNGQVQESDMTRLLDLACRILICTAVGGFIFVGIVVVVKVIVGW